MVQAGILVGFSSFLDWRPLEFTRPLPAIMCCSLCGVVSKSSYLLGQCFHSFCRKCHKRVIEMDSPRCPLDGTVVDRESSQTFDFNNSLDDKSVRCPNSRNGCTFVGPACELEGHFAGCDFHAVPCPSCKTRILRFEMWNHAQSTCVFREVDSGHTGASENPGSSSAINGADSLMSAVQDSSNLMLKSVYECAEALKRSESLVTNLTTTSDDIYQVIMNTRDTLNALVEDRVRREEFDVWNLAVPGSQSDDAFAPGCPRNNIFVFDNIDQKQVRAAAASGSLCFVARTPFGRVVVDGFQVHMRQVCKVEEGVCRFEFNMLFEETGLSTPISSVLFLKLISQRNDNYLYWRYGANSVLPNVWVTFRPSKERFTQSFLESSNYLMNDKIVFVLEVGQNSYPHRAKGRAWT